MIDHLICGKQIDIERIETHFLVGDHLASLVKPKFIQNFNISFSTFLVSSHGSYGDILKINMKNKTKSLFSVFSEKRLSFSQIFVTVTGQIWSFY